MYWRSSEFFLGDSLYIVPVHHPGETGRFLFLPRGHWYSLWTDQPAASAGEEVWVSTPMDRIPVFVRGGHIIPRWPVQQFVGELPAPELTLDLWWAPETEADSYLYEDAGDGRAHRLGDFCFMHFHYSAGLRSMQITAAREGLLPPAQDTATLALHALPNNARPTVLADGVPCPGEFNGSRVYQASIPTTFKHLEIGL